LTEKRFLGFFDLVFFHLLFFFEAQTTLGKVLINASLMQQKMVYKVLSHPEGTFFWEVFLRKIIVVKTFFFVLSDLSWKNKEIFFSHFLRVFFEKN
jgi:hypothetical protein